MERRLPFIFYYTASGHRNGYCLRPFILNTMFSYFSDPDNVEHFSIGFDLAGKHLPESVIIQIIAEIEGVQEDYPDDRNAVIALDALYDILGERSGAISALAHYTVVFESSIAMLRTARQLTLREEWRKQRICFRRSSN